MSDLKIIAKNAGIFFMGALTIKLFNYLFRVFGSRGLGTEGYGEFVLALAIFNIVATIGLFGIPLGITRYVSYYLGKNKEVDAANAVKSGTLITFMLSIVLSICLFLGASWVANLINHPEITHLIKIFAVGLPFFAIVTCLERALEGFKQMKYSVPAMNILHGTKLVAIVLFLALGFKEEGAVWSYVIGIVVASVAMIYFLEKKVFPVVKKGLVSFSASKTLLLYSWSLIVAEVATPIIAWTDSIVLGYFFPTAEVGIYNIGITTAALLLIIFTSFSTIVFPMITKHIAKGNKKAMKKQHQVVSNWILTLTLPIIVICLFFPKQILTLLYGYEFSAGADVFVLLTIAYLVFVLVGPLGAIILATGRTKMSMFNVTSTAVLNLVLNIILIPKWGMFGAGVASMCSLIYISVLRFSEVYFLEGVYSFSKRLIKPFLSAGISLGILLLGINLFITHVRTIYVVPISLIYALIYAVLLVKVFKLDNEEIRIMNKILEKIGLTKFGLNLKER